MEYISRFVQLQNGLHSIAPKENARERYSCRHASSHVCLVVDSRKPLLPHASDFALNTNYPMNALRASAWIALIIYSHA